MGVDSIECGPRRLGSLDTGDVGKTREPRGCTWEGKPKPYSGDVRPCNDSGRLNGNP